MKTSIPTLIKQKPRQEKKEKSNKLLINWLKKSKWLRKYVIKNDDKDKFYRVIKGLKKEVSDLEKIFDYNPQKAERIMDEWLAVDIYPEYSRDTMQMLEFIKLMNLKLVIL